MSQRYITQLISTLVTVTVALGAAGCASKEPESARHAELREIIEPMILERPYSKTEAIDVATDIVLSQGTDDDPGTSTPEEAEAVVESLDLDWADNALRDSRDYVSRGGAASKQSLEESLAESGYSSTEIDYAIEHLDWDWNAQAAAHAIELDAEYTYNSRAEQIALMESSGFTSQEAQRAVDQLDADWHARATRVARYYALETKPESIKGILEERGFTREEIAYAIDEIGGQGS